MERLLQPYIERLQKASHRSLYLNANPGKYSSRIVDISELDIFEKGFAKKVLETLLDSEKGHFSIKMKLLENSPQESTEIDSSLQSKRLDEILHLFERLKHDAENIKRDKGYDSLKIGYPILMVPRKNEKKPYFAPLYLWHVEMQQLKRNEWKITFDKQKNETLLNQPLCNELGKDGIEIKEKFEKKNHPINLANINSLIKNILDQFGIISEIPNLFEPYLFPKEIEKNEIKVIPSLVLGRFERDKERVLKDLLELEAFNKQGPSVNLFLYSEKGKKTNIHKETSDICSQLELDASQKEAVDSAIFKGNTVIHGPPGTGKSQVISEIIVKALYEQKTVLICCEKKAALEVIQKRLIKIGLSEFCLYVHEQKQGTRDAYNNIRSLKEDLRASRDILDPKLKDIETKQKSYKKFVATLSKYAKILKYDDTSGESLRSLLAAKIYLKANTKKNSQEKSCNFYMQDYLAVKSEILNFDSYFNEPNIFATSIINFLSPKWAYLKREKAIALKEDLQNLQKIHSLEALAYSELSSQLRIESLQEMDMQIIKILAHEIQYGLDISDFFTLAKLKNFPATQLFFQDAIFFDRENVPKEIWQLTASERTTILNLLLKTYKWHSSFLGKILSWIFIPHKNLLAKKLVYKFLKMKLDAKSLIKMIHAIKKTNALEKFSQEESLQYDDFSDLEKKFYALLLWWEKLKALVPSCGNPASKRPRLLEELEIFGVLADSELIMNFSQAQKITKKILAVEKTIQNEYCLNSTAWTKKLDVLQAKAKIDKLVDEAKLLNNIYRYYQILAKLPLESALAIKNLENLSPLKEQQVLNQLKLQAVRNEITLILEKNEEFLHYQVGDLDRLVKKHLETEDSIRDLGIKYLLQSLKERRDSILSSFSLSELRSEFVLRGKNYKSLREKFSESEDILLRTFPVWLVPPDIASSIFPLKEGLFDIAIFDEASQIRIEDAIPSLHRAKRIVVAGDEMQMPPSRFFEGAKYDSDDYANDYIRDEDSSIIELSNEDDLLQASKNADFIDCKLLNHYRSDNPSLINYSNYAFYNAELAIMPQLTQAINPAIELLKIAGCYEQRKNISEAQEVVRLLKKISQSPYLEKCSIGIISFNSEQARLIAKEVFEAAVKDERLDIFLRAKKSQEIDGEYKGLFIKNLEEVQGDERDIIIISTTFAKDSKGNFARRFGPLAQEGGRRRLNVIISRAKRKMYILTSICETEYSCDLQELAKRSPERAFFYGFLCYARDVSFDSQTDALLQNISSLSEKFQKGRSFAQRIQSCALIEELAKKLQIEFPFLEVTTFFSAGSYIFDILISAKEAFLAFELDPIANANSPLAILEECSKTRNFAKRGWTVKRLWSTDFLVDFNESYNKVTKTIQAFFKEKDLERKKPNLPQGQTIQPRSNFFIGLDVI